MIVAILIITSLFGIHHSQDQSSINLHEVYKNILFSTKTPYKLIRNGTKLYLPDKDYETSFIYLLARHGSRFPSSKNFDKISSLIEKLKKSTVSWKDTLKASDYQFAEERYSELSNVGRREHYNFGKRLTEYFPGFVEEQTKEKDGKKNYRVLSTCVQRSMESLFSLVGGIRYKTNASIEFHPCDDSSHLRFYDYCPIYREVQKKAKEKNPDILKHSEYSKLVEKLKTKLGISDIDINDVQTLKYMCALDASKNPTLIQQGHICKLFTIQDHALLELASDASTYRKSGKFSQINFDCASGLMHNILKWFKILEGKSDPKEELPVDFVTLKKGFLFQVAHAETLLPLLGLMGYFDKLDQHDPRVDVSFTSQNVEQLLQNERIFRSAGFTPMGGNFMLIFMKKRTSGKDIVVPVLNESVKPIKCCMEKNKKNKIEDFYCRLDDFMECFKNFQDFDPFNEVCHEPKSEL